MERNRKCGCCCCNKLIIMKNYSKYMKKIDSMLAEDPKVKKTPASGLLSPSKIPTKTKQGTDTDSQVANYISMIRKTKQELINGR